MKVYILLDDSKSCYDAGGIYAGVFSSMEEVNEYLSRYDRFDRAMFSVEEEEI